jgi:halimadienyl-diphosphate synthase
MMNTAYDTAWVIRLGDLDSSLSFQALDWLCEHQLPDGSWGASELAYYHDRVICTLAAVNTLARRGRRSLDRARWERGLAALENLTRGQTKQLIVPPDRTTIGFEMIVPTLLAEAGSLGLAPKYSERALGWLRDQRSKKLGLLQGRKINRFVSTAFSAEMAGPDAMGLLDVDNLQERNGSIAVSPAATAYFATYVRPGDLKAIEYLRKVVVGGGVPNTAPLDVFERAWTLWNLALLDSLDAETFALCQPHLDFLSAVWQPERGVGHTSEVSFQEGDDTNVTYETLQHFNRSLDLATVMSYEEDRYFRCFHYEANPSISTNIHALGALRKGGLEVTHPSVQKLIRFLESVKTVETFWFDKWHASPYYASAHAIIACAGFVDELAVTAVDWILRTQSPEGSWGYYLPTAEETAYCLQALAIWQRNGHDVPKEVLRRGAVWLADHMADRYPPLWIGKCLYCPELVVRSAILSALQLGA